MALTKADAKQMAQARAMLSADVGYYARTVSAMHRAAKRPQAVLDEIKADGTESLFSWYNGCLVSAVPGWMVRPAYKPQAAKAAA